jgi:TatD DNase family protein
MIKLVDSHAHLDMPEFDPDRDDVIRQAGAEGICAVCCPIEVTDPQSIRTTLDLTERFPQIIAAAGVHPHQAKDFSKESVQKIRDLALTGAIRAVGEIGLDFFYSFSPPQKQIHVFRQQLALAQDLDLPVIIHSREAAQEVETALKEEGFKRGGVLHCFTESRDFAEKMLAQGFWISFSGIVTFPKALDIQDSARSLPADRILLETDSPFLTPVPFRGKIKRNEPKFVSQTADFLAKLRGVPLAELADQTTRNFMTCFTFDIPGY